MRPLPSKLFILSRPHSLIRNQMLMNISIIDKRASADEASAYVVDKRASADEASAYVVDK